MLSKSFLDIIHHSSSEPRGEVDGNGWELRREAVILVFLLNCSSLVVQHLRVGGTFTSSQP